MHIYSRNGAVPIILSCTGHMFLVTRDYVEMAHVFLPRTDHMILQNILIFGTNINECQCAMLGG